MISCFCFSGCQPELPAPDRAGAALSEQERSEIFGHLQAKSAEITSYRALAEASIAARGETTRLRYAVAEITPDRFRLEALPVNTVYTLSLLVMRGEQIIYLDVAERSAVRGQAGQGMLAEMTQLPITERELMAYATGRMPPELLALFEQEQGDMYRAADTGNVLLVDRRGSRYWEISTQTFDLLRVHVRDALRDRALLDLRLDGYAEVDGVRIPHSLHAAIPPQDVQVALEFVVGRVNPELPDALFELKIPAGYRLK